MLDRSAQQFLADPDPALQIRHAAPIDVTVAVESALARRAGEQEALFRFTDRLYRANALADAYDAALDAIVDTLQCKAASILRFDQNGVECGLVGIGQRAGAVEPVGESKQRLVFAGAAGESAIERIGGVRRYGRLQLG